MVIVSPSTGDRRMSRDIPNGRKSGRNSMKELIKQYLDNGMSRRQLMTGLSALGMSTVAAKSVAQSLETFGQGAAAPAAAVRQVRGTGGALFVEQLKAAGVEYVFFNPVDRRLSDLRRAGGRARHQTDQGRSRRRRGRHGGRLCARLRQDRRRHRGQYRPAQRHDPDGQQLEGPDPDPGRRRLGRPGRARARSVPGDRLRRDHDASHHQVVLVGEDRPWRSRRRCAAA